MGSQSHHVTVPTVDEDSLGDLTEPDIHTPHTKALFKEALDASIAEAKEEIKASARLRDRIPSHHVSHSHTEIHIPLETV
jgi:hypothetical protein